MEQDQDSANQMTNCQNTMIQQHSLLTLSHAQDWAEVDRDSDIYKHILIEVCRRCPEFHKNFFPTGPYFESSEFSIYRFELNFYRLFDLVFIHKPAAMGKREYSVYGFIPKSMNWHENNSGTAEKTELLSQSLDHTHVSIGNFYPLFRIENLKHYNTLMGLSLDQSVRIYLKNYMSDGVSNSFKYLEPTQDVTDKTEVRKQEGKNWSEVINQDKYLIQLNDQNNLESIVQYLMLNLSLRGLQLTKNSFNKLQGWRGERFKTLVNDKQREKAFPFQYFVYELNEKLRIVVDDLELKDKVGKLQRVKVQIIPETGDVFFLSKPNTHKNLIHKLEFVNTHFECRMIKSSQTATPIIRSWQMTGDKIVDRIRTSLLSFSLPVQHINKSIIRHARLPCYQRAHLVEILVPECGIYRRSYALTHNLYDDEPELLPIDHRMDGFFEFNQIKGILDFERYNFATEAIWPEVRSDLWVIPEREPIECENALVFYIKLYSWIFHSYHIVHHPDALSFTQVPLAIDNQKLEHVFRRNLYEIEEINKRFASFKYEVKEDSFVELGCFTFFYQQSILSKKVTIHLEQDQIGLVSYDDVPYIYEYHKLPIERSVFGEEPLVYLRTQEPLSFHHYLIDKNIHQPIQDVDKPYIDEHKDLPGCFSGINNFSIKEYLKTQRHFDNLEFDIPITIQDSFDFGSPELNTFESNAPDTYIKNGSKRFYPHSTIDSDDPIVIHHCDFNKGFSISDFSQLPTIIFYRCQFLSGFDASNIRLNASLIFIECVFKCFRVHHQGSKQENLSTTAINFFNAKLKGELAFYRCMIAGRFQGAGLHVARSLRFRGTIIKEKISEVADPFSPKSISVKRELLNTETNKALRNTPENEVNPFYKESISFRTLITVSYTQDEDKTVISQYLQSSLINILLSFIFDQPEEAEKALGDLFPEVLFIGNSIGITGQKIELLKEHLRVVQGFKLSSLKSLNEEKRGKNDIETAWILDILHHLLLDRICISVFGESLHTMYVRRVRQAKLILDAENSGSEWRSTPALSLEYASIGGDFELVASPHEQYYASNIEECFKSPTADTERAWVTHISSDVCLRHVKVKGNVNLTGFICQGSVDLKLAEVEGDVVGFSHSAYASYIRTPHLIVFGDVVLDDANIRGYVELYRAFVKKDLKFYSSHIKGNVNVHGMYVGGNLDFTYCGITGYLFSIERPELTRLLPAEKRHDNLWVNGDILLSGARIEKVEFRGITVMGGIYIITGEFGQLIFSLGFHWSSEKQSTDFFIVKPWSCVASNITIRTITVKEDVNLTGIKVWTSIANPLTHPSQLKYSRGLQLSNSNIGGDLEFSSERFLEDMDELFKNSQSRLYWVPFDPSPTNLSFDRMGAHSMRFGNEPKQIDIRSEIQGHLQLFSNRISGHADLRNTSVRGSILLHDSQIQRRLNIGSIYPVDIDYRAGLKTHCHRLEMDRLECDGEVNFAGLRIHPINDDNISENKRIPISLTATNVKVNNAFYFILPPRHAKEEYLVENKFPLAKVHYGINFTGSTIFRLTISGENIEGASEYEKRTKFRSLSLPEIDLDRCIIDHLMLVKKKNAEGFPKLSLADTSINSWEFKHLEDNTTSNGERYVDDYVENSDDFIQILNALEIVEKNVWIGIERQFRQHGFLKQADKVYNKMRQAEVKQKKNRFFKEFDQGSLFLQPLKWLMMVLVGFYFDLKHVASTYLFSITRSPMFLFSIIALSTFVLSQEKNIMPSLSAIEAHGIQECGGTKAEQSLSDPDTCIKLSDEQQLTFDQICLSTKVPYYSICRESWSVMSGFLLSLQYLVPLLDNEFEGNWMARDIPNINKKCQIYTDSEDHKLWSIVESYFKEEWCDFNQNWSPKNAVDFLAALFWLGILSFSWYGFQAARYSATG